MGDHYGEGPQDQSGALCAAPLRSRVRPQSLGVVLVIIPTPFVIIGSIAALVLVIAAVLLLLAVISAVLVLLRIDGLDIFGIVINRTL